MLTLELLEDTIGAWNRRLMPDQRLLAHRSAEFTQSHYAGVERTPPNNAVKIGRRTALYGLRQRRTLLIVHPRLVTWSHAAIV